jgi:hypothetical protein
VQNRVRLHASGMSMFHLNDRWAEAEQFDVRYTLPLYAIEVTWYADSSGFVYPTVPSSPCPAGPSEGFDWRMSLVPAFHRAYLAFVLGII